jgi:hypothetical protein
MTDKQHAVELLARLDESQLAAVVHLLETIIGDNETVTDEDRRRYREGRRAFDNGKGVSMEDVLAEFGLKPDDFPLEKR